MDLRTANQIGILLTLLAGPAFAQGGATVSIRELLPGGKIGSPKSVPKMVLSSEEWKAKLPIEVFYVARGAGMEPSGSGRFLGHKEQGTYICACCEMPLFSSNNRYDSRTGWLSFTKPITPENVVTSPGTGGGVTTKVTCARCDAFLGAMFNDGPPPTRQRFSINSGSLGFLDKTDLKNYKLKPATPAEEEKPAETAAPAESPPPAPEAAPATGEKPGPAEQPPEAAAPAAAEAQATPATPPPAEPPAAGPGPSQSPAGTPPPAAPPVAAPEAQAPAPEPAAGQP